MKIARRNRLRCFKTESKTVDSRVRGNDDCGRAVLIWIFDSTAERKLIDRFVD